MADAEVLKATGLYGLHSWISIAGYVFAALAAVCAAVAYVLPHVAQRNYDRDLRAALQQEGLTNALWSQTERRLTELGFDRREIGHGLVLFQRKPERTDEGVPLVEAVIRRNHNTVAIAEIVALDDRHSWAYASYEAMTDGATVEEAVAQSNIPRWLARRSDNALDVVGVGIASFARGQRTAPTPAEGERVNLTRERATRLARQFRQTAGFVASRPVRYWTLELGNAKTVRDRDSLEETRQRAAIIVALSRRQTIEGGPITPEEALALIATNVHVYGTDLTDYQHSNAPQINELP